MKTAARREHRGWCDLHRRPAPVIIESNLLGEVRTTLGRSDGVGGDPGRPQRGCQPSDQAAPGWDYVHGGAVSGARPGGVVVRVRRTPAPAGFRLGKGGTLGPSTSSLSPHSWYSPNACEAALPGSAPQEVRGPTGGAACDLAALGAGTSSNGRDIADILHFPCLVYTFLVPPGDSRTHVSLMRALRGADAILSECKVRRLPLPQ